MNAPSPPPRTGKRRLILPRPNGPARRWSLHAPAAARMVRVTEIRPETDDAVTLLLESEDGKPIPFRAGQYLTHCFDVGGESLRRAFSISSAEGQRLACTIKALPDGRVSQHVLKTLKAGDRYPVLGPSGDFVLPQQADAPLLFLAGGSGITPVMSLIETALAQNPQRAIRLAYVNRGPAQAIFGERLEQMAARHPNFHLTLLWTGRNPRPDAAALVRALQPEPQALAYLCGPKGLMDSGAFALRAAGFPPDRVRRERFLAAPRVQPRPTTAQDIVFKRSGRTVAQQPGESILDAGLRAGLKLEFSCTVGGCGHCKVKVLKGHTLLNEPNCLSDVERAGGWTLACSACATGPLTVDA